MAASDNLSGAQFGGGLSGPSEPSGVPNGSLPDPDNMSVEGRPETGGGNESKASPKTWLEKLPKVDHRASSYAGSIYGAIRPGA